MPPVAAELLRQIGALCAHTMVQERVLDANQFVVIGASPGDAFSFPRDVAILSGHLRTGKSVNF